MASQAQVPDCVLAPGDAAALDQALAPLASAVWWIRACAVFNALLGLVLVLSILGIPFGAALGWVAFLEWRAASRIEAARRDRSPGQSLALAEGAMRDIALHYIIQAVLTTSMILLGLLLVAAIGPLVGHLPSMLR